ncbi:hypothetical protein P153DRAFT_429268 [Dothidotthia symphoricarpi CBS 119687]|uniref:Ribophorin II C-terminal domain-containing protein n=1 Tax=Dothidotthia symphoricarpi CBS 119687 TaxID=1392245 RepID=A0A6A6AMF9_9PLEO|nr:uncharacterized protein P153DRAFT_429268 [Dothidotthia symphoricarpi CBS 119687]KAF2132067.1 hypothetical protein P153DRAFT_429268 [Dothidotthia symphoricarpi CBS 119687]
MRVHERKQVDLREVCTIVDYHHFIGGVYGDETSGVSYATHMLGISKPSTRVATPIHLFTAECGARGWRMWGVNTDGSTADVTGPKVIVDALVHCIDRASGRDAVHDPDTENDLRQKVTQYEALNKMSGLKSEDHLDWKWAEQELKRRHKAMNVFGNCETEPNKKGGQKDNGTGNENWEYMGEDRTRVLRQAEGATIASAASSWGFEDATVAISGKGAGVGGGSKQQLSSSTPLSKSVSLGATDSLKLLLTTVDGETAKRPHQAFLTLTEPTTGLEESFVFSIKESGKGKVDLTQKDLPHQFLTSSKPIIASIVIGSFGESTPYKRKVFNLNVSRDANVPLAVPEPPVRYAAESEIHHIFREDPRSPPKIITVVFAAAVAAAFPVLLGVWATLGANANHISKALGDAPVSHALFYGSILSMEGIFFLYYTSWNLFQTLPAAAIVGFVAFLSGSRALSEVQERRLAGLR